MLLTGEGVLYGGLLLQRHRIRLEEIGAHEAINTSLSRFLSCEVHPPLLFWRLLHPTPFSRYRVAVRPIIKNGILRTSFSRDHRQRENDTAVDPTVRVPCPVHNEALGVLVPSVKHRKTK